MSLSRWCQSESNEWTGAKDSPPPLVLAPEPALGAHSCVALSSAQVNGSITKSTRTGNRDHSPVDCGASNAYGRAKRRSVRCQLFLGRDSCYHYRHRNHNPQTQHLYRIILYHPSAALFLLPEFVSSRYEKTRSAPRANGVFQRYYPPQNAYRAYISYRPYASQ